ncbi:MAG: hypothetical protein EBU82_11420 [Flavobacteriia bacterium]|nr:hypothetical protein [Flavobacteriia bacterium]NBP28471.1 hypothetical protein [Flavobacteriia bacterium]
MQASNTLLFHMDRLSENIDCINDRMSSIGMHWTFIIKAFNHYPSAAIQEFSSLRCKSIGSDNLKHLSLLKSLNPSLETWFLNYKGISIEDNSIDINLTHSGNNITSKTCLMLDIDADRHGHPYENGLSCNRFGAYLDCSKLPDQRFFKAWKNLRIPERSTQSLGTSVSFEHIELLKSSGVNHFRLGEIVLLGRSLMNQQPIDGLRTDVFERNKPVTYHCISTLKPL